MSRAFACIGCERARYGACLPAGRKGKRKGSSVKRPRQASTPSELELQGEVGQTSSSPLVSDSRIRKLAPRRCNSSRWDVVHRTAMELIVMQGDRRQLYSTLICRCLHTRQPFRDFLWARRAIPDTRTRSEQHPSGNRTIGDTYTGTCCLRQ